MVVQSQLLANNLHDIASFAIEKLQDDVVNSDRFGDGLPKPMVDDMLRTSYRFWAQLSKIEGRDIDVADPLEVEEAKDLMRKVADMNDGLSKGTDPQRLRLLFESIKDKMNDLQ
jgi:hypothetical protein